MRIFPIPRSVWPVRVVSIVVAGCAAATAGAGTVGAGAVGAVAPVTVRQETAAHDDVVAFVNVRVLPMDRERVVDNQTVVVRGDRIAAMGPAGEVDIPAGARLIEGNGQYLMPGLGEMHGHLPTRGTGPELTEAFLFLYVANGLTTVRGMQGHPSQLELRDRIASGEVLGPRLYVGSPAMAGGGPNAVRDAARAEELVRSYRDQGFDLVKVHEGLSRAAYDAVARTAREVGIPFGGHVPDDVGLFAALEAGQITIDHLDNFVEALAPDEAREGAEAMYGVSELVDMIDDERILEAVQALNDAGAWVVPTMVLWEDGLLVTRTAAEILAERPEVRYLPPEFTEQWTQAVDGRVGTADIEANRKVANLRRRILATIHANGSRILLGTDSPQIFSVPGFSIHHEMALWVEVGMTPFDVLETGTRKVAEYFHAADEFGTVAAGQRADLVLLRASPLDDIGNFADRAGVMVAGRWLPEDEIQARLAELAARYAGNPGSR